MARRTSQATDLNAAFDDPGPATTAAAAGASPGGDAAEGALAYLPMMVLSSEEDQRAFMEYICSEIKDVRDGNDRKGLEARWKKWRRQRQAVPESAERDTPWIKSSNVEPPLTMQKVNTVFAKLLGAYAVKKPPVCVEALSKDDREVADSLERWFKNLHDNRYGLDMRRKLKTIFYNVASLGTEFVKVPFRVDQWSFKRTTEAGQEQVTFVKHRGPAVVPIRLEDFFTRPYWKDLQRAPWLAVRTRYFFHELKQLEQQGLFQNVELILNQSLSTYDENLTAALSQAGIEPTGLGAIDSNKEYEIYECNVFWDVDGDGVAEDVIAFVEPDTGTLLRAEFNPLSVRDIEPVGYLDDPEALYSVGVCQMTEASQEEVTALHRMRLDGTQLSMLKMFVGRKGVGLDPNEEFYPMKLMLLDDPQADFKPIDFPDISPSCIMGEQMAKEYADRVTGANDYMAGFNDKIVGANATVGGTTFLAGQANSILNSLLENTEQALTNIYMLVLYQCIANKDKVDLGMLSPEDAANVAKVLAMDVTEIPTKFRFSVRTTDINKTDEAKKQNMLMATQLYSTYGQQMMQILMAKANPQLGASPEMQELLNSMYVGGTAFMAKVLDFFDVGNPDDFLPFVEHIKVQLRAADMVRAEQTRAMKEQLNGQSQGGAPGAGGPQMGLGAGLGGGPGLAGPGAGAPPGAVPPGPGAPGPGGPGF